MINQINGLFDEDYSLDSTITRNRTDKVIVCKFQKISTEELSEMSDESLIFDVDIVE